MFRNVAFVVGLHCLAGSAYASDGILTAHPTNKGKEVRDIEGKHGDVLSCLGRGG